MEWYEALILGIVQGLTEFLPISSSGHLEIASYILKTNPSENLIFKSKNLKYIIRAGSGLDNIDIKTAKKKKY